MPTNLHAQGGRSRLPFLPVLHNEGYTARGMGTATMFIFFAGGQTEPLADLTGSISVIKYAEPLNDEDGRRGGICTRTGMWAPGHELVIVDGKPMIRDFAAREPRRRR